MFNWFFYSNFVLSRTNTTTQGQNWTGSVSSLPTFTVVVEKLAVCGYNLTMVDMIGNRYDRDHGEEHIAVVPCMSACVNPKRPSFFFKFCMIVPREQAIKLIIAIKFFERAFKWQSSCMHSKL